MRKGEYKTISMTVKELKDGFKLLRDLRPCATVFGSSRATKKDPLYKEAVLLGRFLGDLGFSVITGAGPGFMEAVNKGAKLSKSLSIGLNIALPIQQKHNKYLDRVYTFKYFYVRKVMFVKYAEMIIAFPGGTGTRDEVWEVLTLIYEKKINPVPVILVGKDYWKIFVTVIKDMIKRGYIGVEFLSLFKIAESANDVIGQLKL